MLPLLAWRLDAVEHGAPGAAEPAELGELVNRCFCTLEHRCAWYRAGLRRQKEGFLPMPVCCSTARAVPAGALFACWNSAVPGTSWLAEREGRSLHSPGCCITARAAPAAPLPLSTACRAPWRAPIATSQHLLQDGAKASPGMGSTGFLLVNL